MIDFMQEYFILERPDNDRLPLLVPDANTEAMKYWDEKFKYKGTPLFLMISINNQEAMTIFLR